jgi:hypothetical protein
MLDDDVCAHGDHRAPVTGGACPCGLVTRVPVHSDVPDDHGVRDLIARCLVERGGVTALPDLRRRAEAILGALAQAGLVVAPRAPAAAPAAQLSA